MWKADLENYPTSPKEFVFDLIVLQISSARSSLKHVDELYGFQKQDVGLRGGSSDAEPWVALRRRSQPYFYYFSY